MDNLSSPTPAPPAAPNNRNRMYLMGGIGAVILLCCCCVLVVGGVLWADPFGWNLLGRLLGGADPLAAAVPADTSLYSTVDVAQFTSPKMQKLVEAFSGVPGAEGVTTTDEAIKKMDESLQKDLGLTFSDDILPWAGQYMGLAVSNLSADSFSGLSSSPGDIVFIVEARDPKKAEAFVSKFTTLTAEKSNTTFDTSEYSGVTIYTQVSDFDQPLVMALSKNLLLISNSATAVQHAIDAQQGKTDSLAKSDAFKATRKLLPTARLLTLFMPAEPILAAVRASSASSGVDLSTAQDSLKALQGIALSVAVVEAGVQIDTVVTYNEKELSADQRQLLQLGGAAASPTRLPESTLAYIILQRPDLIWANYRDTLNAASPGDFDDAMTSFENQFGFNPDTGFMPHLDGELVIALLPDNQGYIAETGQGNVGFVLAAQTSDEGAIQGALAALNDAAEAQGTSIGQETLAGMEAYSMEAGTGSPMGYYGVGQKWLTIASSAEVFTDLYTTGGALSSSNAHRDLWANFPKDVSPVFYADVRGLWALAEEANLTNGLGSEAAAYVEPFKAIAAGAAPLKSGALHSTVIVFIEKP